jgi:hypothetical protein
MGRGVMGLSRPHQSLAGTPNLDRLSESSCHHIPHRVHLLCLDALTSLSLWLHRFRFSRHTLNNETSLQWLNQTSQRFIPLLFIHLFGLLRCALHILGFMAPKFCRMHLLGPLEHSRSSLHSFQQIIAAMQLLCLYNSVQRHG